MQNSYALSTIEAAIQGLQDLKSSIEDEFNKAITLILNCSGRVIVTGIGKSGHVAGKIASTLASTGTAAYYIHPAEASHGDLGMITNKDVIIALSNSGETIELRDIIAYSRKFNIPLIAMVRNLDSTLAKKADITLLVPNSPEACHLNAPTTSCIMMLSLGDAIAVTLHHLRGFQKEDFRIFHPGGKLGASLLKVKDIMHPISNIPKVFSGSKMSEALIAMTSSGFGCVAIVNQENILAGIITDGDLRRHMSDHITTMEVEDVMTVSPTTITGEEMLVEALMIMNDKKITNLLITDSSRVLKGVIHIHDCLRVGITNNN